MSGVIRYNPERVQLKDNSMKVWSQLTKQFLRRRFLNILADISGPGLQEGFSDTIPKENHLRTLPTKFGPNLPNSFRGNF